MLQHAAMKAVFAASLPAPSYAALFVPNAFMLEWIFMQIELALKINCWKWMRG
jgi:hypothetical protein